MIVAVEQRLGAGLLGGDHRFEQSVKRGPDGRRSRGGRRDADAMPSGWVAGSFGSLFGDRRRGVTAGGGGARR